MGISSSKAEQNARSKQKEPIKPLIFQRVLFDPLQKKWRVKLGLTRFKMLKHVDTAYPETGFLNQLKGSSLKTLYFSHPYNTVLSEYWIHVLPTFKKLRFFHPLVQPLSFLPFGQIIKGMKKNLQVIKGLLKLRSIALTDRGRENISPPLAQPLIGTLRRSNCTKLCLNLFYLEANFFEKLPLSIKRLKLYRTALIAKDKIISPLGPTLLSWIKHNENLEMLSAVSLNGLPMPGKRSVEFEEILCALALKKTLISFTYKFPSSYSDSSPVKYLGTQLYQDLKESKNFKPSLTKLLNGECFRYFQLHCHYPFGGSIKIVDLSAFFDVKSSKKTQLSLKLKGFSLFKIKEAAKYQSLEYSGENGCPQHYRHGKKL